MVTAAAYAQDITVTGTVTDASTGEGIVGASVVSVVLKGSTTQWAMTDDMGAYSLTVPANGVLEVTFLGYTTLEVPVNGRTSIDIELVPEATTLDDVIVVAYGTAKKESFTGSAAVVKNDDIIKRSVSNVSKALEGLVAGVEVNGGEMLDADFVVSDIHPAETVALIWETKAVRKVYRRRISALGNTFGMFTANIRLKPGSLKYINRNIYLHRAGADVWNPRPGKTDSVLVSWSVPYDGTDYAISLDLLSPMWWSEVEKWYGLPYGHRWEDYVQFKRMKTEECMSLAERRIPGLRDAVDRIYTSTPLSYRSCLCSPEGSAYGVRKDWRSPMTTVLAPKTPLPGLLLTGQSLGLHGLLGVSMTSVFTCAEIIGLDALATEILCQNNKT